MRPVAHHEQYRFRMPLGKSCEGAQQIFLAFQPVMPSEIADDKPALDPQGGAHLERRRMVPNAGTCRLRTQNRKGSRRSFRAPRSAGSSSEFESRWREPQSWWPPRSPDFPGPAAHAAARGATAGKSHRGSAGRSPAGNPKPRSPPPRRSELRHSDGHAGYLLGVPAESRPAAESRG